MTCNANVYGQTPITAMIAAQDQRVTPAVSSSFQKAMKEASIFLANASPPTVSPEMPSMSAPVPPSIYATPETPSAPVSSAPADHGWILPAVGVGLLGLLAVVL